MSVLETQVAGNHYSRGGIQPISYIHANELNFFEGNAVKYVTRHKFKNGAEDIKKVIHYCQMILEFDYEIESTITYPTTMPPPVVPQGVFVPMGGVVVLPDILP